MPALVENKLRLVATAASRSRLSTDRTSLRDLASEIEWAKTTLATPDDYPARAKAAGREPPFEAAAVAAVYASYESAKQRDGALDFEDLLLVTAYALEEHPDVAREVRGQYRHFVVDEYQDVNPLQQRLLDAWLGRARRRLRRRRPQPDDLLLHRRRPRLPAGLRRPLSRRRGRQAGARLPLHAAGGRPGQPADRPGAAAQGAARACGCSASAPTAAEPTLRRVSRRAGRGRRRRGRAAGR